MSRNREIPNPLGIAFLDLICCAMAATLILYLLTDADSPQRPKRDGTMAWVAVTLQDNSAGQLAARLVVNGEPSSSWSNHGSDIVLWQPKPGGLFALVMQRPTQPMRLELFMSNLFIFDKPTQPVFVQTMGTPLEGNKIELPAQTLYRKSITVNTDWSVN